jgi:hypothetical protein
VRPPNLQITKAKWTGGMPQVVKHLQEFIPEFYPEKRIKKKVLQTFRWKRSLSHGTKIGKVKKN